MEDQYLIYSGKYSAEKLTFQLEQPQLPVPTPPATTLMPPLAEAAASATGGTPG